MKTLDELEHDVVQWAESKGIMDSATPITQMYKMQEEVDELLDEVGLQNTEGVKDELGDVIVTACIQAAMWNTSLAECLEAAYTKISARSGEMRNGVFIKEDDL